MSPALRFRLSEYGLSRHLREEEPVPLSARLSPSAQRTKAYHTSLDTQRGLLVGWSHKKLEFTSYVFSPGWSDPTVVVELRWSF